MKQLTFIKRINGKHWVGDGFPLIAGQYQDTHGAAHTLSPINLWDRAVAAGQPVTLELPAGHTAMLLVMRGAITVSGQRIGSGELSTTTAPGAWAL